MDDPDRTTTTTDQEHEADVGLYAPPHRYTRDIDAEAPAPQPTRPSGDPPSAEPPRGNDSAGHPSGG